MIRRCLFTLASLLSLLLYLATMAAVLTVRGKTLAIPYYAVAILFAWLPSLWFVKFLKRRKQRRIGRCHACSYDLTGNSSGVCPECGTAVAEKAG